MSKPQAKEILGIIDRGVGGLGLYKKLKEDSDRSIIYFADNANLPYGLIEQGVLKQRLDLIIEHLKKHGATKIVFACNSASVVYPDTDDIKGIIPFGVSILMNSKAKNPALIATKGTVKSKAYHQLFQQHGIKVAEIEAQQFAVFVEDGVINGKEIEDYAKETVTPLASSDAVLMACTHFPAIKPLLQQHLSKNCLLLDPVDEMVPWIKGNWPVSDSAKSQTSDFHITGSRKNFIKSAKTSFNVNINESQTHHINHESFDLELL